MTTFKFNPFSGVLDDDIEKTLVPRYNMDHIISRINKSKLIAMELLGKQGRGKTSHLIYLQSQMAEYPIFSIYLMTKVIESTIGVISMETIKSKDTFVCKLSTSSSSTYSTVIYKSGRHEVPKSTAKPIVKFNYPVRNDLASFEYNDITVFWQMNIEGDFLGLALHYKCVFEVKRR